KIIYLQGGMLQLVESRQVRPDHDADLTRSKMAHLLGRQARLPAHEIKHRPGQGQGLQAVVSLVEQANMHGNPSFPDLPLLPCGRFIHGFSFWASRSAAKCLKIRKNPLPGANSPVIISRRSLSCPMMPSWD